METTKKIKRVNKDEPTGFDRFNRVSKGANAVLNIIFIIMSLLCVIPILILYIILQKQIIGGVVAGAVK